MSRNQEVLSQAVAVIAQEVTEHSRQFAHAFGQANGWSATDEHETYSLAALMFHAVAVAATRTLSGSFLPDAFEATLVDDLHRALVNDLDFAGISALGVARSRKLFVSYYARIAVTLGRAEEAGSFGTDNCQASLRKAAQNLFQGMFGAQVMRAHACLVDRHLDTLMDFYWDELGLAPQ